MAGGTFKVLLELEKNASIQTLAALHNLPGIADIHLDFDQFNKTSAARQFHRSRMYRRCATEFKRRTIFDAGKGRVTRLAS